MTKDDPFGLETDAARTRIRPRVQDRPAQLEWQSLVQLNRYNVNRGRSAGPPVGAAARDHRLQRPLARGHRADDGGTAMALDEILQHGAILLVPSGDGRWGRRRGRRRGWRRLATVQRGRRVPSQPLRAHAHCLALAVAEHLPAGVYTPPEVHEHSGGHCWRGMLSRGGFYTASTDSPTLLAVALSLPRASFFNSMIIEKYTFYYTFYYSIS